MTDKSPVFIKIEEYRSVLDVLDELKKQVVDVRETMQEIDDIRAEEESNLQQWREKLNEVEKKILFVDQALFEPEN